MEYDKNFTKFTEEFIGIYCIYNSKYFYVGLSINVLKRLELHKSELLKNKHYNKFIQRVYNNYNESDPFIFRPIYKCKAIDLNKYELEIFNDILEITNKIPLNIQKCGLLGDPYFSGYKRSQTTKNRPRYDKRVPYVQLDKLGNLIKIWDSLISAQKGLGISIHTEKHSCGGYQWLRYSDWLINPKGVILHKHNIDDTIKLYTLQGELVKEYLNISVIISEYPEFKRSPIVACLKNRLKSYKGYIWRYKYNNSPYDGKPSYGNSKKVGKFTLDGKLVKQYKSIIEASKDTSVNNDTLSRYIKFSKILDGFIWKRL